MPHILIIAYEPWRGSLICAQLREEGVEAFAVPNIIQAIIEN